RGRQRRVPATRARPGRAGHVHLRAAAPRRCARGRVGGGGARSALARAERRPCSHPATRGEGGEPGGPLRPLRSREIRERGPALKLGASHFPQWTAGAAAMTFLLMALVMGGSPKLEVEPTGGVFTSTEGVEVAVAALRSHGTRRALVRITRVGA